MRQKYFFLFAIPLFVLVSCEPPETDFSSLIRRTEPAVETATDVEIFYSDSARIKVKITGPVSKRLTRGYNVEEEFPEGVHVEFYDARGDVASWLDSKYAIRKEADKIVIARENVVLQNVKGERLETSELIWDERKKEIYSDHFVKITTAKGEVIYSHTFKSNENFTRTELKAIEGDMLMEEI